MMPVDKGRLPSEPKAAVPVSQYRIDRGNRYSIRFAETLHRVLGDVAEGRVCHGIRSAHDL
jgi:hypothetical protein